MRQGGRIRINRVGRRQAHNGTRARFSFLGRLFFSDWLHLRDALTAANGSSRYHDGCCGHFGVFLRECRGGRGNAEEKISIDGFGGDDRSSRSGWEGL